MADWISKPQSCPGSLPSVRWLLPVFVIVMETWLKQQAVSLTYDNRFSDWLPMPYPPNPTPQQIRTSAWFPQLSLGWGWVRMELVSLLSAGDLSAPSRASVKYLKTRVWRERGSTFQSWKNFKGVHTTGTCAWLGFHSASVIPNEEGSNCSLPPKQPISIQKIVD